MRHLALIGALAASAPACAGPGDPCGPSTGQVARVIDGDTVELASGERVRYLLVDAPELSGTPECFGPEARQYNEDLVLGQEVSLRYDAECEDRYGRLLAYVARGDREINRLLVERGYACVLYIPPNGEARVSEMRSLEAAAKAESRGMWGQCEVIGCN